MLWIVRKFANWIGTGARAFVALVGIAGITIAAANYTMTQGAGTTFGSIVVSTVHYAQQLICDPVSPANCGLVKAGNTAATTDVAQVVTDPNVLAAVNSPIPAGTNTIGTTGSLPYPVGATPITASATGTTGATTATLAGAVGKTTYICGYSIRANATAATTVTNTITGVITATLSSVMWVAPLASGLGIDEQIFSPCIPASGTNQAIAVVSGAPGSGGTVSSKGWGYQL